MGQSNTSVQVNILNITRYLHRILWRYIRPQKIGIIDGSNSTTALCIESSTECGFSLGWQGASPWNSAWNIWDCVGFYAMHTFLFHQLRAISNHFKPLNLPHTFQSGKMFKCASHFLHRKPYFPFQDLSQAKRSGHFESETLLLSSSAFHKNPSFCQVI